MEECAMGDMRRQIGRIAEPGRIARLGASPAIRESGFDF